MGHKLGPAKTKNRIIKSELAQRKVRPRARVSQSRVTLEASNLYDGKGTPPDLGGIQVG